MVLLSMVRPLCSFQCLPLGNKNSRKGKSKLEKKKSKTPNAEKASASLVARSHRYSRAATWASSRVAVACGMQSKDGDDTLKGLPTWLGDLWGLASPQPPAPLSRASSMLGRARNRLCRCSSTGTAGLTYEAVAQETHAVAGDAR